MSGMVFTTNKWGLLSRDSVDENTCSIRNWKDKYQGNNNNLFTGNQFLSFKNSRVPEIFNTNDS